MRQKIHIIDSHTGGEPTRLVVSGGPDLGSGSLAERRDRFARDFDRYRSAIVNEPRGSDVLVGALLQDPVDASCSAGVIFFNNVGCLQMCGHGTIGLVATLAFMNRIEPGDHRIETPAGVVTATLHEGGQVSVRNVPSHRKVAGAKVTLSDGSVVSGDVAWGGNWFFLVSEDQHGQELTLDRVDGLTEYAWQLRRAINAQGHPEVDHVELFGPPQDPAHDSRNFVLCPGGAYDRSPCGTGTSAKLACLHADGKLKPGQVWRQESIIGSVFEGEVALDGDELIPTIKGRAHVNAEASLVLDKEDPFCWGIGVS